MCIMQVFQTLICGKDGITTFLLKKILVKFSDTLRLKLSIHNARNHSKISNREKINKSYLSNSRSLD